jgi:hypothetical protein
MATKIDLAKYARDCLQKREQNKTSLIPGPVVTISREFGCPAKIIARELTDAINNKKKRNKWCQKRQKDQEYNRQSNKKNC